MFSKNIEDMTKEEILEELTNLRSLRKKGYEEKKKKKKRNEISNSLIGISAEQAEEILIKLKIEGL